MRLSLSALTFYCNRPTVIAALDLVTAITADVQPKRDDESPPQVADANEGSQKSTEKDAKNSPDASGNVGKVGKDEDAVDGGGDKIEGDDKENPQASSADNDGVVTTINPKVVEDVDELGNPKIAPKRKDSVVKGLLGKGKDRVVFLLVLDMELAEIVLNNEDGSQLSTLSQDNFHTDVKVLLNFHEYSIDNLFRLFSYLFANAHLKFFFHGVSFSLFQ